MERAADKAAQVAPADDDERQSMEINGIIDGNNRRLRAQATCRFVCPSFRFGGAPFYFASNHHHHRQPNEKLCPTLVGSLELIFNLFAMAPLLQLQVQRKLINQIGTCLKKWSRSKWERPAERRALIYWPSKFCEMPRGSVSSAPDEKCHLNTFN